MEFNEISINFTCINKCSLLYNIQNIASHYLIKDMLNISSLNPSLHMPPLKSDMSSLLQILFLRDFLTCFFFIGCLSCTIFLPVLLPESYFSTISMYSSVKVLLFFVEQLRKSQSIASIHSYGCFILSIISLDVISRNFNLIMQLRYNFANFLRIKLYQTDLEICIVWRELFTLHNLSNELHFQFL